MSYLQMELDIVRPKLVVLLGRDAEKAYKRLPDHPSGKLRVVAVKHPAYFLHRQDTNGVKNWIIDLSLLLKEITSGNDSK